MKFRYLLNTAGALLVAATATAQTDASSQLVATPGAPQDGGVYDYATATWGSTLSPLAAGADRLDLTGQDQTSVDAGRLPSTSSPDDMFSLTGTADAYPVYSFELAYCTSETAPEITISFYDSYDACDDATLLAPLKTLSFTGPGSASSGTLSCWVVTIDLGDSADIFTMSADGDGFYDGDASLDNFGWSFAQTNAEPSGPAGPLVAGDPFALLGNPSCAWGDGTVWSGNTNAGSGLGTDDLFELDAAGSMQSCNFFGGYLVGNPFASLQLAIEGDSGGSSGPVEGAQYCAEIVYNCPCSVTSAAGEGCPNTTGAGGTLIATGNPSIAASTFNLTAAQLPDTVGLFVQGVNAIGGADGNPVGEGRLCLNPQKRFQPQTIAGGTVSRSNFQNFATAGAAMNYQFWYRDPSNNCAGGGFNFTPAWNVTWLP